MADLDVGEAVKVWLASATAAMPDDGCFTDQVLRRVGNLPVPIVPEYVPGMKTDDGFFQRVAAASYDRSLGKTTVTKTIAWQIEQNTIDAANEREHLNAGRLTLMNTYLQQIRAYVDRLE